MSTGAASGAAAAINSDNRSANAIKASGVLVQVEAKEFLDILQKQPGSLVVHAKGGFFTTTYQYLTSYKGLAFFTKTSEAIELPSSIELVNARSISIPD